MNNADKEYLRLGRDILSLGRPKKDRTGTGTIGMFGNQARFSFHEGFPILTTKKVYWKGIVHELLWFLSGSTNIKYLLDNDVHIWDGDCYRRYKERRKELLLLDSTLLSQEEFIDKIKTDNDFAQKWGDLGQGTYGQMWRAFPYASYWEIPRGASYAGSRTGHELKTVDQLQKVIDKLKTNPDDRRMIVSAWHPYWVDHCALPPCHCLFHFNTEELTIEERKALAIKAGTWDGDKDEYETRDWTEEQYTTWVTSLFDNAGIPKRRLNCGLYQRSADYFLGVPFNISSYCLLTAMIAQVINMVPGEFVHSFGDLHIYNNHVKAVEEQFTRDFFPLPQLWLNPEIKNVFDFKFEDIRLIDYRSHGKIKAEVSVGL